MRMTPLVFTAVAALMLSACSDSSTDQTQTQSIDQEKVPAMQDDTAAAVPDQPNEKQRPTAPTD